MKRDKLWMKSLLVVVISFVSPWYITFAVDWALNINHYTYHIYQHTLYLYIHYLLIYIVIFWVGSFLYAFVFLKLRHIWLFYLDLFLCFVSSFWFIVCFIFWLIVCVHYKQESVWSNFCFCFLLLFLHMFNSFSPSIAFLTLPSQPSSAQLSHTQTHAF